MKARGIYIDEFRPRLPDVPIQHFLLTHAHSDHMVGLTRTFARRPAAPIYCTAQTARLAQIAVKGLTPDHFRVLRYQEPCRLGPQATLWAFPSFHCDGSAMFLVALHGPVPDVHEPVWNELRPGEPLRILYTGDFRFCLPMRRECALLADTLVHRLYYDDTFDDLDVPVPCFSDICQALDRTLTHLLSSGRFRHVYINAAVLGVEPVLRWLARHRQMRLGLCPRLKTHLRGEQLQYLLGPHLDLEGEVVGCPVRVGHRRLSVVRPPDAWVVLTCTAFLCPAASVKEGLAPTFRVKFCTHSNHAEINEFKQFVSPLSTNACEEVVRLKELRCRRGAS